MSKKLQKATHHGSLTIGEINIKCAVLEDETRVLSERSVGDALGFKANSSYWKKKKEGESVVVPQYIAASNLLPFIDEKLFEKLSKSTLYISKGSIVSNGVPAEVLPDICHVWIKARDEGALSAAQKKVAERAYILLKGFATVGIIALVDEATGYQEVRDRDALQKILKAYISEELLPWTKRFPDEFYKEMFRLNGWAFNPASVKRPSVIGTWTNKLVYKQLPPGILQELKKNTPRDNKGRAKHRFHQLLTNDIGNPHLEKQLVSVITLMNVSNNWRDFLRLFARKFGQQEIDFIE